MMTVNDRQPQEGKRVYLVPEVQRFSTVHGLIKLDEIVELSQAEEGR
jgi:hypothetical protein